jgi:hypothetical protein
MYLLFQAILFYVPRWLWKNWEAGKIHALMMDLDIGVVQVIAIIDIYVWQRKSLISMAAKIIDIYGSENH